jgi:hypothetical protein
MVISVQEWRQRNAPVEVELPSGPVVLLRKVHIVDLVLNGTVPATLVTEAQQYSREGKLDAARLMSDPKEMEKWLGLINPVVMAAFVEPKVGRESSADQLGIEEISGGDKLAVFQWCNEGAAALEPFRAQPDKRVEPVPDGAGVRAEAE